MAIPQEALRSLVELRTRSPHEWLGLHARTDGPGLVVRALVPNAAQVEIQPSREPAMPVVKLSRMGNTDVFEGTTEAASRAYAYDLVVTDGAGRLGRPPGPDSF